VFRGVRGGDRACLSSIDHTSDVPTVAKPHRVVLGLLAERNHQITVQRTRTICRLHALLCCWSRDGTGRSLTAAEAEALLVSGPNDDVLRRERHNVTAPIEALAAS
jgi:hypothetical protein